MSYAAIGDLIRCNYLSNLCNPWKPCFLMHGITCSQISKTSIGSVKCQSSAVCFCVAVWSCARNDPQSGLFGVVKEKLNILARGFKIIDTFRGRMVGPKEVDTASISEGFV